MNEFVVPIRPRYGEVDRMGVVYHAHYLVYFELGRTELMRALGVPYADVEEQGHELVVVEAGLRYRRPAGYDQPLALAAWVQTLGRASVTFAYELRDETGTSLATGHTRLGCVDRRRRPTPIPAWIARRLDAGRRDGAPASQPS